MRFIILSLLMSIPCLAQTKNVQNEVEEILTAVVKAKKSEERLGLITTTPEHAPFFGYSGPLGPEHWADLDDDWALCGDDGTSQSPININAGETVVGADAGITFNYVPSSLGIVNNGHTVQFNYTGGSSITVGDHTYSLKQFHFHTPSEHRFENGAVFDMEMHLVHADSDGNLAVVGVLMVPSEEAEAVNFPFENAEDFSRVLPRAAGVEQVFFFDTIDASVFLPEDHATYRYSGSLTTPPCSENVSWFVMREPIKVNAEEVAVLRAALNNLEFAGREGNNNRPSQPLHGRTVQLVE